MTEDHKSDIDILSSEEVRRFIIDHQDDDLNALALQSKKYALLPIKSIISQIASRRKAKDKLPLFYENENIIYPVGVSLQQSSSQLTAQYKADLLSGKAITDLTGGFGIDLFFMSQSFDKAHYVEQNEALLEVVKYNYDALGNNKTSFHASTAQEYLAQEEAQSDYYYIDPARRGTANERLVLIEDCSPNLLEILPMLLEKKRKVMVKLSPLLDIHLASKVLPNASQIHIVSVNNECKELLFLFDDDSLTTETQIIAVNLVGGDQSVFSFNYKQESIAKSTFAFPLQYLYEPNASVMKSGGFDTVSERFGVMKLARNTHLYTSDSFINNFPGRRFEMVAVTSASKKKLKPFLSQNKANISLRNYPSTVKDLRQKTGVKEGGDVYLFATTLMDGKRVMLVCRKV